MSNITCITCRRGAYDNEKGDIICANCGEEEHTCECTPIEEKKKEYIITSNYKYKIAANSSEEALEKWNEKIEEELNTINTTLVNEFVESLEAVEVEKN